MPRYLPALLILAGLAGLGFVTGQPLHAQILTLGGSPATATSLSDPGPPRPAILPHPSFERIKLPSIAEMHQHYLDAFVGADGFGVSRVVSVEELNFRAGFLQMDGIPFHVVRVQLIGLLQHPAPVVYVPNYVRMDGSAHRPAAKTSRPMVDSSTSPTRPLNDFEKKALREIQLGDTKIVVGASEAVGALTATASCIDCHDVKPGTLLGAFTYGLEPIPAVK